MLSTLKGTQLTIFDALENQPMMTDREAELLQEILAEYDVHAVLYAVLKQHDRNAVKLALWNLGLQVSN